MERGERPTAAGLALITWAGLALQFSVTYGLSLARGEGLLWATARYLGYFTLLSNILVAKTFTAIALAPRSGPLRGLTEPLWRGGVLVAIVMVGIAYSLLLRHLWAPTGAQWYADWILHDVTPVLTLAHWLRYGRKGGLRSSHAYLWLSYPAAYLIYALLRGKATGWFPYPFLDLSVLSATRVVLNIVALSAGFLVVGLAVVRLDRWLGRRRA